jgi:enolase
MKIQKAHARELLDSRGFPTLEAEVDVVLSDGRSQAFRAIVPSGASTGEGEAVELRDGVASRFLGKGVEKAVSHVSGAISGALEGKTMMTQEALDQALIQLDGTESKSRLGANAILGVSMAVARGLSVDSAVGSKTQGLELVRFLARTYGIPLKELLLPVPLMNVINGGKHADNGLAIQEFMIVPHGFSSFREALRAGVEIFHHLKKHLKSLGLSTGVGDEGGFAPAVPGEYPHEQVLSWLVTAIQAAGYEPGKQVSLALDCAASEFSAKGADGNVIYDFEGRKFQAAQMTEIYEKWIKKFPIVSIEDGHSEHDWKGWAECTQRLGSQVQLVGDDLFVTNLKLLAKGVASRAANSILIKLNQIGTVTETLKTMSMAKSAGYSQIVSHRSGETEDTFIADLAVATGCGQIKTGSASRTDRLAKYNQLLRLEEALRQETGEAKFAGSSIFKRRNVS